MGNIYSLGNNVPKLLLDKYYQIKSKTITHYLVTIQI